MTRNAPPLAMEAHIPLKPAPHVIERSKLHAELAGAGFHLVHEHGIYSVVRSSDKKTFIEGIDITRVMDVFRANRHRARRAA